MKKIRVIVNRKKMQESKSIVIKTIFHCFKCGKTLPPPHINPDGLIITKCPNPKCREVSRFIVVKGKVKLLTKRLLAKLKDKDLTPYTKGDIFKLVVDN